jgi:coiled-coil domain-containing protein 12
LISDVFLHSFNARCFDTTTLIIITTTTTLTATATTMSSSRKSRLKELRELSEKEEVLGGSATALKEEDLFINPSPAANDDEETNVTIKLRNYVPKDISALKATSVGVQILPNAVAPEFKRKKEEENGNTPDDTILHSNGTKKQNWDLKRDVARKTEKLERRTIRAIAELAREEEEKRES